MEPIIVSGLLWFSALGCGLMAGIYFAFSAFIMSSFARLEPRAGIDAMNAINVEIVKSLFMPLFIGTPLAAAVLAVLALARWDEPGSIAALSGGVIYVIGMLAVTMLFNVPLNNALAAVDASSTDGAAVWLRYVQDWTFWNHIRTAASLMACTLYVMAIVAK